MYGILSILTVLFHAIGAFLAFLYIYLHVQIRPIQKHPGPLIYHQILMLGLFSALNTLYLTVKLLASTVSLPEEVIEISSKIQEALEFYSTVNLISYQIFIGIEVFIKSLFSYLRKWYKLRVKLYHYLAHLNAVVSLGIFAQDFIEGVNYVKYIVHAIIPGCLIILSVIFIYGTQCSLDNLENSPKKRFCSDITSHLKTVLYMKSFWILSCFIKQAYDESTNKQAYIKLKVGIYVFYYFFEWSSLIIIMMARLGQTHTCSYLKDSIRRARKPKINRSRYKQHTEIDETSSAESNIKNSKAGNLVVDTENKIVIVI